MMAKGFKRPMSLAFIGGADVCQERHDCLKKKSNQWFFVHYFVLSSNKIDPQDTPA